jgi:hypothetical protein
MKKCFWIVLVFCSLTSFSQPLRDINYKYLYNPEAPVSLQIRPVRAESSFTILYNLQVKDTADLSRYTIEWQSRSMLSDKESGGQVTLNDAVSLRTATGLHGKGTIDLSTAPKYLVAKLINNASRQAWIFYTNLEPDYPVNNYLTRSGFRVTESFVYTNDKVRLALDSHEWIVSYYDDNFPAAAPIFSEGQARVARVMAVDSVYKVRGMEEVNFPMKGLFLIQKDTTALEGFSFRVEEDYPQYSKLANLSGPLIYITTRQEYDRLESAGTNKKAFDRVVLSITTDTERARILMRNYFRRVELANRYFTSYKEGWKTDRGMVYIIFGIPDQVYKFSDREVWRYKNDQFDINFTFSRSNSLFDPDNYVLIREKKFESTWYEVIDLWRNARF